MNYCIIIPDFRGIGGAQLYAFRRCRYLMKKGIRVHLVVAKIDTLLLDAGNKDIPVFVNSGIISFAFDLSSRICNQISHEFHHFFKGDNESIIETFDVVGSTWGELFAEKLKCKHFIYSLVEPSIYKNIQDRPIYDFYKFKLLRKELIGLSSMSLGIIFGRKIDYVDNRYVNISFDLDELVEKTEPEICKEIDKNSFVIGTVSRLEKSYIPYFVDDVITFANKYKESAFTLIVAGNSEVGMYKLEFEKKYLNSDKQPPNLIILFPGYLHPLGKDFFNCLDIFIGMGTVAVESISQACATIVIDPISNLSSGIFGVDTKNFAYSENGKQYSILESLEVLYINREKLIEAKNNGFRLFKEHFDSLECMHKLDNYIDDSSKTLNYWSFDKIKIGHKIIRYLYKNKDQRILQFFNKLRH